MTEGYDINGRKMQYQLYSAVQLHKCFDCGEIIQIAQEYFRMRQPQEIDVCLRCGRRRKMK